MEFQLSYFKSCKMMLGKCCPQYASKFGKPSSGHKTGKGQFSLQSQRKAMPKNAQTSAQMHSCHMLVNNAQNSPSQASAIHKPWISRCSSWFRKDRETRDQIANICWIIEKQESSRKTSISALLTMPKPLTVWITINCGKLWKRWEYQTSWPASWETCRQVRKQQLELDMEQQTGSN